MKSIVEEASSVLKAIEKGWNRAGKPEEFTVKVFNESEKNFFGLTTKSAKIALLFKSCEPAHASRSSKQDKSRDKIARSKRTKSSTSTQQTSRRESDQPKQIKKHEQQKKQDIKKEKQTIIWTQDMIAQATKWIADMLKELDREHVSFDVEAGKYTLRFNFNSPVLTDPEKEKRLFRSWAHLLMQTIRNKHKKSFRGAKIILNST